MDRKKLTSSPIDKINKAKREKKQIESFQADEYPFNHSFITKSSSGFEKITYIHNKNSNYYNNVSPGLTGGITKYYETLINNLVSNEWTKLINEYKETEQKILLTYQKLFAPEAKTPSAILEHMNNQFFNTEDINNRHAAITKAIQDMRSILLSPPKTVEGTTATDDQLILLVRSYLDTTGKVTAADFDTLKTVFGIDIDYIKSQQGLFKELTTTLLNMPAGIWSDIIDGTTVYNASYLRALHKIDAIAAGGLTEMTAKGEGKSRIKVKRDFEGVKRRLTQDFGTIGEPLFALAAIDLCESLVKKDDQKSYEAKPVGFIYGRNNGGALSSNLTTSRGKDRITAIADYKVNGLVKQMTSTLNAKMATSFADKDTLVTDFAIKIKDSSGENDGEDYQFNFDLKLNPDNYKSSTRSYSVNVESFLNSLSASNLGVMDQFLYVLLNDVMLGRQSWNIDPIGKLMWLSFAIGLTGQKKSNKGIEGGAIADVFGAPDDKRHASLMVLGRKIYLFSDFLQVVAKRSSGFVKPILEFSGANTELENFTKIKESIFTPEFYDINKVDKYSPQSFQLFWKDKRAEEAGITLNEKLRQNALLKYSFEIKISTFKE